MLMTCIRVPLAALAIVASIGHGQPANTPSASTGAIEQLRSWLSRPADKRGAIGGEACAGIALTREAAEEARGLLWDDRIAALSVERKAEWEAKSFTLDGKTLKFEYRIFGQTPANGRSMFISMHGGGGAPAEVNDQQWKNQIGLYTPTEGIYVAPRAPTDAWNMWHEAHIDPLFDRLIQDAVIFERVDPDRVYLMGYSAGGDGVYQVAPRMADRFAAAAMMAGHPNEASPVNLRNLPFIINVGANDGAYDRNAIARRWGEQLDELARKDGGGYIHETHLREGMGHWMKLQDASAVPWMMQYTRQALPERVVWRQDDVLEGRLYWLAADPEQRKAGASVTVSRAGQVFTVEAAEGIERFQILLRDGLVDMDLPVKVVQGDAVLFEGKVSRTVGEMARTLEERGDPKLVFLGRIEVALPAGKAR